MSVDRPTTTNRNVVKAPSDHEAHLAAADVAPHLPGFTLVVVNDLSLEVNEMGKLMHL